MRGVVYLQQVEFLNFGFKMPEINFSSMNDNKDSNLSILAFISSFFPWVVVVVLASIRLSLVATVVVDVDQQQRVRIFSK